MDVKSVSSRLADGLYQLRVLTETGIVAPMRPDKAAKVVRSLLTGGTTPATGIRIAATKYPKRTFIVDERGSLTFGEVHRRTNALADSLADRGVGPGDGVGIMCRNHRGFVEATLAASKLGATALFLNTMFSGPQLAEVLEREGARILLYDDEFQELLADVPEGLDRVVAWGDGDEDIHTLDHLIAYGSPADHPASSVASRFIILTSGTTGSPKGAQRTSPEGLSALTGLLGAIPHRSGETMVIAAPLFHSWGFLNFVIGLPLGAKLVLRRRFDPQKTLVDIEQNAADVLVAVPIMLSRILELGPAEIAAHRTNLKITTLSGSALPGELATEWMDAFGDNLYNLYGSTEVAFASVATPEDLRADPATAGRPPHGTVVKLFDEHGDEVPEGRTGRIFVGSQMSFEGYTGGGGKEAIGGMLSSGDVGHFDRHGRLFIDGRDDEMIVSGGENVYPREIEDLLAAHPKVADAAVIGVEDEEFGQRLKAFVVPAGTGEGAGLDESEVKAYVKENLASYKAPREVVFLEELPRNATGKILKRALQ